MLKGWCRSLHLSWDAVVRVGRPTRACLSARGLCGAVQSAPGITPALVERIVTSRPDLTKADVKEVGRLRRWAAVFHLGPVQVWNKSCSSGDALRPVPG